MKRFAIRSARALRAREETTQFLDRAEFRVVLSRDRMQDGNNKIARERRLKRS